MLSKTICFIVCLCEMKYGDAIDDLKYGNQNPSTLLAVMTFLPPDLSGAHSSSRPEPFSLEQHVHVYHMRHTCRCCVCSRYICTLRIFRPRGYTCWAVISQGVNVRRSIGWRKCIFVVVIDRRRRMTWSMRNQKFKDNDSEI